MERIIQQPITGHGVERFLQASNYSPKWISSLTAQACLEYTSTYLCWRWPHLSSALAKPPIAATGSSSWPARAGRNRSFDIVHQTVEVERVAKSNLSESSGCRCCWWRCAGCCSDYWFQCFWCRRSWWLRFRTRPIRSMSHTFRYFPLSRFVWNYFLEHFGKQRIFSPQIHWIFTVNPLRFPAKKKKKQKYQLLLNGMFSRDSYNFT